MSKMNPFKDCFLYQEFPYFLYEDQKIILKNLTKGLNKNTVDISNVFDRKSEIFNNVYHDQIFLMNLVIEGKQFLDFKQEVYWE